MENECALMYIKGTNSEKNKKLLKLKRYARDWLKSEEVNYMVPFCFKPNDCYGEALNVYVEGGK